MTIKPGALRFNTDSMKLEIFRGSANYNGSASMAGIGTLAAGQWEEIQATSPDVQTGGTRALLLGGYNPSSQYLNEILYVNIATTGNTQNFGDLIVDGHTHVNSAVSDRTRAISAGGSPNTSPHYTNAIQYVTIASTGNSIDFNGDLLNRSYAKGNCANSTRGIFAGGNNFPGTIVSGIEYLNIQSTGTNTQDFGDLTTGREYPASTMCSPTRGVYAGGRNPGYINTMDYITLSTLGNAADFGDLTRSRSFGTTGSITSNAIRGITMGGYDSGAYVDVIDYITISTLGDALDFGNLLSARGAGGGASSSTRCIMMGGGSPGYTSTIQYVQIMSTGDSIDFGDIYNCNVTSPCGAFAQAFGAGASNGHGGL